MVDSATGGAVSLGGDETVSSLGLPSWREGGAPRGDIVLGHRRLSILDLSPRGHQPMAAPGGEIWAVFNGEIYNYIELREELADGGEPFESGTDTEVMLRAWQRWGPDCLHRFNGDWAIALLDLRGDAPRLHLARDRWGVKPLYYCEHDGAFWFGSEAKALVGTAVPFAPDGRAVARFLQNGELPASDRGGTFFAGVRQLPPGGALTVGSGGVEETQWYRLRDRCAEVEGPRPDAAVSEMEDQVDRAVGVRLRSDVPLGSCLSGGVDSSSIVGTMRRQLPGGADLHTFSAVYRERGPFDESQWIDEVVGQAGCISHKTYPDELPLHEMFERLVWHQDEPFSSPSIFAQWCVMREASAAGVTVLLDGQAADELFAGYQPGVHQEEFLELLGQGRRLAALRASVARKFATGESWRALWRDLRAALVYGPLGVLARGGPPPLPPPLGELGFRPEVAAEHFPKATLDPDAVAAKLAEDEGKLRRWQDQAKRASGARLDELAAKMAKKRGQIARGLAKLVQAGHGGRRGRRRVARLRARGWFDHSLRERLLGQTTSNNLSHLLRYEDRNSMAFSIEARVPFTDFKLVEWAFRRANHVKIRRGWTKWVLREAMRDRVPRRVLWRRDKVGFETPELLFARRMLAARAGVELSESPLLERFLEPAAVRATCRRVAGGGGSAGEGRMVWRWLVLESWYRQFASAGAGADEG